VPVPRHEKTPIFRFLSVTIVPIMYALMGFRYTGTRNVPREGGFILAPNHFSNLDPLLVGIGLWKAGRAPHFMGKASLFRVPVLGALLRATEQIPVERGGVARDADPLEAATTAVREGTGVIVYPEGTLTRDPDLWPMRGKTGAVRLALSAGVPIIPCAHWGAEKVLPPYAKFPRFIPRRTFDIRFGEPVDLSAFAGRPLDARLLSEATALVMASITTLVEELRGEKGPAKRWDPSEHNQSEFGRP
jgi:1-acyl-sn-glycerol-3-phosphate acyltransferase